MNGNGLVRCRGHGWRADGRPCGQPLALEGDHHWRFVRTVPRLEDGDPEFVVLWCHRCRVANEFEVSLAVLTPAGVGPRIGP